MADNGQNIVATPYPFYATGADDSDDSFKAALISHGNASVERNQDSQFAALRTQQVHRDVEAGKRETAQAKFDVVSAQKDSEIRSVERFAEIKAELAALRAEGLQRDVRTLERQIDQKNQDETKSLLATILAKLPV